MIPASFRFHIFANPVGDAIPESDPPISQFSSCGSGGQRNEFGADASWCRIRSVVPLYGPEKPLFEKTWKLPDIEEAK